MDKLFGTVQQQPTTPPTASTPGNIPDSAAVNGATAATTATAANGTIPANAAATESPLDSFSELWQPNKTDGDGTPKGIFAGLDPAKLQEAASKTDFSKVISPENLSAIAAGGEAGVKAFVDSMNKVAQTVYAQSAFASTKMIEQALGKAKEQYQSELPSLIKQHQVSDNLRTENPIFSHAAAAPVLKAIESQMALKYPNATASEITSQAKNYLEAFAGAITPTKTEDSAKTSKSSGAREETDWTNFI